MRSCCVLTWQKRGESSELSGVSFISTLIPSMEALPLRPIHLAKDQSPNGYHIGDYISTYEFCGGHKQPVAIREFDEVREKRA